MATIDNNITFEEFRNRCEDKTTLTAKGQLYAATSETVTVNGKTITRTAATPTPSANSLLVQDLNQASGLNWKSVANVFNDAIAVGQEIYVKRADVATNVESYIDGKSISDIFEEDRTTVKKATKAINASSANNAINTDFTNAEWIDVSDGTTGPIKLEEGATYEIIPYNGDNTSKYAVGSCLLVYNKMFNSIISNHLMAVTISDRTYLKEYSTNVLIREQIVATIRNDSISVTEQQWSYTCANSTFTVTTDGVKNKSFIYRRIR